MPRAACRYCHRAYGVNPASRFQPVCPRCRERLHPVSPREERRFSSLAREANPPARRASRERAAPMAPGRIERITRWLPTLLTASLCLTSIMLFGWAFSRRTPPQRLLTQRLRRAGLHERSPFGRALWEERWYRTRAKLAINQEREALLERLPAEESARIDRETWRRQLMALDHSGDLHRARRAGLRAEALARGSEEKYQAALWLDLVEGDAGHPQAEMEQAHRMMELDPHNELSLVALRRAAADNRVQPLEEQAEAVLKKLRESPAAVRTRD